MERLLAEAMDAGAFGFSTGLVYAPSVYARHRGARLARPQHGEPARALLLAHPRRGGHARAGGRGGHPDRRAGRRGGADRPREGLGPRELGQDGPRCCGDRRRPRPRGGRDRRRLSLPGGQHEDGQPAARLGARRWHRRSCSSASPIPRRAQRAIGDCLVDGERWRTRSGGMGWDEIMIATCSQPELAGLHIAELARRTGKEPAAGHDGSRAGGARRRVDGGVLPERGGRGHRARATPTNMIGSDWLSLHAGPGPHPGKPHPRSYGTFPRVLGVYCGRSGSSPGRPRCTR